jgi:DNA-binding beta-propeller fold protein YncE
VNRREFLAAAAAAPLGLATAPRAAARVLGGTPVALVTADLEAHVVAYDLDAHRVLRRIPTLSGPRSIETVGNNTAALVAHTQAGAISLIDVRTLRVRSVLRGLDEPRYTAAGPTGRYAYVTDAGRGELVTVDLDADRIVHRLAVGAHARHLSHSPTDPVIWTALGFDAPAIVVVDLSTPARPRVAQRIVPPFPAHDVVFAPDGARVWVSSGNQRRLAVYDASTYRPLFLLPAGQPPQHITFRSHAAYVTSDEAIRVHRLADGALRRETAVPAGSYNVTQGDNRVFTPSLERGTLCILDRSGRILASPVLAKAAHDACLVVTA